MPIDVFISYSHKDRKLCEELSVHLSNLHRQGIVSTWYDGNIVPGMEWETQIFSHLTTAQIILLLISADFLASSFCYSTEMTQALARHEAKEARVLPILLRPVYWIGAPFAKLEMLPTGAKAVTEWASEDQAFTNIVWGIKRAIDDLTTPTTSPAELLTITTIAPSEPAKGVGESDQLVQRPTGLSSSSRGQWSLQERQDQLNRLFAQASALNNRLADLKDQRDSGIIEEGRYMLLAAGQEQRRIEILQKVRQELEGLDQDFDAILQDTLIGGVQERVLMDRLAQVAHQHGLAESLINALYRHQGVFLFWLIEVGKQLTK